MVYLIIKTDSYISHMLHVISFCEDFHLKTTNIYFSQLLETQIQHHRCLCLKVFHETTVQLLAKVMVLSERVTGGRIHFQTHSGVCWQGSVHQGWNIFKYYCFKKIFLFLWLSFQNFNYCLILSHSHQTKALFNFKLSFLLFQLDNFYVSILLIFFCRLEVILNSI